jgi:nucleotide-binding universal stress UspA family protein
MGVRGMGAVMNLLMGSTTTKVLSLTDLPVTLVK